MVINANSNEVLILNGTVSAVNEITISNAIASSAPSITSTGTDSDINLLLSGKGNGSVVIAKTDINGGTIDGTAIGGTTAAAGSFTTLSANNNLTFTGNIQGVLPLKFNAGTSTTSFAINATGGDKTITFPNVTGTLATLSGTEEFTNKTLTSATINLGTISGATINSTAIGGTTAAAGSFTTLSANNNLTFTGNIQGVLPLKFNAGTSTTSFAINATGGDKTITFPNITGTLATLSGTEEFTNKTLTSATINSGTISGATINSTAIGGTTAAAGSFTTLSANNNLTFTGNIQGALPLKFNAGTSITSFAINATGGDKTITFPNTTGTLATLDGTETLSSKTLTSPTINSATVSGGTIDNAAIGGTTASTGKFTTVTSTIGIGTAPFTVASNTVVTNLNADLLDGKSAPTGNIVGESDTQTLTNKTLTAPVISGGTIDNAAIGGTTAAAGSFTTLNANNNLTFTGNIQGALPLKFNAGTSTTSFAINATGGDKTITFPNTTGTLTTLDGSETLLNKTLTSPTINSAIVSGGTIDNAAIGGATASTGKFTTVTSTIGIGTAPFTVASNTVVTNLNADLLDGKSAPTGNIVGESDTQTLTNKTLTAPVISCGTIDNAAIGGTTASAGTFTTLAATTLNSPNLSPSIINTDLTLSGNGTGKVVVNSNVKFTGAKYNKVTTTNSAYTVLENDHIIVYTTNANANFTLPDATVNLVGIEYVIFNSGANTITVTLQGDDVLKGTATIGTLTGARIICFSATEWLILH